VRGQWGTNYVHDISIQDGKAYAASIYDGIVYVLNVTNPPPAQEYVFVNTTPYARKIEGNKGRPPSSPQAPDGVYQAVATLARKFSNVAKVTFSYRTVAGGERNPAIIVRLR